MPNPPKISDAEWIVMEAIWSSRSAVAAADVVERLEKSTRWNPRTIKTMLSRLVGKGALAFEADGNRYLYRPKITRSTAVRSESRSFVQRVFGGAVTPLVAHFVEDARLTPEQIRALRKLLDEKGRES